MADKKFTYKDYEDDDVTKAALERYNTLSTSKPTYTDNWSGTLNDLTNKVLNREKFSYDLNGDALYQQYKDNYINQGRMAMMDTMGQASAMTGGYGNSYAQSVGQQAYQSHLQQLNDRVPELYQLALDKYNQEGQDLYNQYSLVSDRESTEYGRHRDSVSDWQYDLGMASDDYWNNKNFGYGMYSDNRDLAHTEFRNEIADDQWGKTHSLNEAQIAASIGDDSKLKALGYDTSKMNTTGGSGTKPLTAEEWGKVRTEAYGIYETYGEDALVDHLQGLLDRGYITKEESQLLLSAIAPVKKTTGASHSGGGGGDKIIPKIMLN